MSLVLTLTSGPTTREPLAFWKDLAALVSAPVAAGAFVFSIFKQRQDARLQRELEAKRRWTAFMDMAFQNPKIAFRPDYSWHLLPEKERGERPIEDVEHKNFISRFLFTAEEVLALAPGDKEWIQSIKSQMYCHKRYFLSEMQANQIACYSFDLQKVISEWRNEAAEKQSKSHA